MPTRLTATHLATVSDAWLRCVGSRREREGLTINTLASDLGVVRQYLSRILNGDQNSIPIELYLAICTRFKIEPTKHLTPNDKATIKWHPHQ